MIQIGIENVLEFLQDENLANPIKVKNENSSNWKIFINDPFISDDKLRLSIGPRKYDDDERGEITKIVFNGFKSSANLGDDYHGDLFNFVKLVMQFDSRVEGKNYFINKYVLRGQNILKKQEQINQKPKEKKELYWPDYVKLQVDLKKHKPYVKFLKKRKFPLNSLDKIKIFVDDKNSRLVFPVYENNELIFHTRRSIVPHKFRWLKSEGDEVYPIWNLNNLDGEEVWIFEGIFDACHVNNGVAIIGVAYQESIKKIINKNFSKYIIVMDNDVAGLQAKLKIAKILRDEYHKDVWIYNYKGIEEKDFGEMKENDVSFELKKRVIPFTLKTEILMKLGKVK